MSDIGRQVAAQTAEPAPDAGGQPSPPLAAEQSATPNTADVKPPAPLPPEVVEKLALLDELKAERDAAKKAAEEAAFVAEREKMTAEERQKMALEEQGRALAAERERLRQDRLLIELDRMNVKTHLRRFIPATIDAATEDGRAELGKFLRDNPEFVGQTADVRPPDLDSLTADHPAVKASGGNLRAMQRAIENARAVGRSDSWIREKYGIR